MSFSTTIHLQKCLQRLNENDHAARADLISFSQRRLKKLADRMLVRYPRLNVKEQSDDLLQEAMIRLWNSLDAVRPVSVAGFMGLAALQMRRALCDLARNHFGRTNAEPNHDQIDLKTQFDAANRTRFTPIDDPGIGPHELTCWTEFHSAADRLPEPQLTAFDLLYYHELSQSEAAEIMNVSIRQIQRYWHSARLRLLELMNGSWPNL